MKLEFGCGDKPRPGFVGCDVRPLSNVQFVCDAWDISQHVKESSVTHIYSRHFFEHLTFEQADATFSACYDILAPGGVFEIIVPDMLFHVQQWINSDRDKTVNSNGMTDEEWAINGFWGRQRVDEHGPNWDVHKSGYDFPLLQKKLAQHGFRQIARLADLPKNLTVTALK
jgi:predicted SAM-dependent methyltransferase